MLQEHGMIGQGENDFKLKEDRYKLGIRKKFFIVGVVRQQQRLPGEVVDAPSLGAFKVTL